MADKGRFGIEREKSLCTKKEEVKNRNNPVML